MIFVSGIHGVGKSFFCDMVNTLTGIETYSASDLISKKKHEEFSNNKHTRNIDVNQQYLVAAVNEFNESCKDFILDGHFCLLDANGDIQRIPQDTFEMLKPDAIILLTEKPEIIAHRRRNRDGIIVSLQSIDDFQRAEVTYATEISKLLNAKLFISSGASDYEDAISFITSK